MHMADCVTPNGRTSVRMMVGKRYLLLNMDLIPHGHVILLAFQVLYLERLQSVSRGICIQIYPGIKAVAL